MESVSHQRLKNIIIIALLGMAIASYFLYFKPPLSNEENIEKFILKRIALIEKKLEALNQEYQERAELLYRLYRSNQLQHNQLNPKEALIIEQHGAIKNYYGEMYFIKLLPMEIGEQAFVEKNKNIYFLYKIADHVFFTSFFCNQEDTDLLSYTSFALSEIKYSKIPLLALENKYIYDNLHDLISYYHLLANSNDQFFLHLKFSKQDVESVYKKTEKIYFCSVISLFFLIGILYFYKRKPLFAQLFWLSFLVGQFLLIVLLTKEHSSLFIPITLGIATVNITSLYQVLVFSIFIISVLYFFRKRLKNKLISYVFFNIALVVVIKATEIVFKGIQFNYLEFGWNKFILILVTALLHFIPLLFILKISHQWEEIPKNLKQKLVAAGIFLGAQSVIILVLHIKYNVPLNNILLLSLAASILLFIKKNFFSRAVTIFIISISIYHLTAGHSLREKQGFIENNLKNIFLNQGNYAKFIAREIIHELNLSRSDLSDFYEFFEGNTSLKLENIWRRTIASRENIASGIFVVSRENEVLSYFAYQIPFFKVKLKNNFPFWAMEDTTGEIHGREIPLAAAYISIYKDWEYLGRIMVLVSNSPSLLLRYQDKVNIFTIDNKIDGRDFSFIKLNADNQIIENPSNLNLENITGILSHHNQWIKFKAMDMIFKGYIFRYSGNTVIIFFPSNTVFNSFSGVIKIFLILSLLVLIFYIRGLKQIEWKSIYYSFSIRVFAILILISFLTAILFSVFFINFSTQSSEQKVIRMVYENGRTAQNIAYDMIKSSSEFSRDYLFSLSDILSGDVSVYEDDGGLVETSNYRKIINSQIPDYLHSKILSLLNDKNQKFVLMEDEKNFNLYFKIYNYIFMTEFSNKWEKILSEERYYTDFVITIFFILIIIGFSAAFFFRNKIISPINGLNIGMAEVERGNLPKLQKIPSELEIKNLYLGFNNMIEGIREQKRAISEMSRMKTIIRLGRRVAHEVKNPLTPIKLSAEQILKALKDKNPNYQEIIIQSVNYIIDETDHLKKVSYGFLDLSRLDEINAEEIDLMDLVREELFNATQIYSHIAFTFTINGKDVEPRTKSIRIVLDKVKIKQVLKNLIANSIEAIGDKKGTIGINVKQELQNQRVILEVVDNGIGMDENEISQAFEVDYSTKEIGTGLGLFIAKRIIELHKGTIEIHSQKNEGTRVVIDLPGKTV